MITCTKNKLQVWHHAQVPCEPFRVDVKDEFEAIKIMDALADQHLFLFEQKIIPDYSNSISVYMFDESKNDWVNYFNEEMHEEWEYIEDMIRKKFLTT